MTSVLVAFSDTGGGHRAAATAIRAALQSADVDIDVSMVDPFALCRRWPFRSLGTSYPRVINRAPWFWHAGFRATNTPPRTRIIHRLAWPALRSTFEAIAAEHVPDVIVSTHPLLATPLRRVYPATPIVTVVTDLVSGHVSWYDPAADLLVVPTTTARDRAVGCGMPRERIDVVGVPITDAFVAVPGEKLLLCAQLGWATDRPTVLLAGGAEGIGALEALSVAIDRAQLPCDIAVVAGRNAALAARLRARRWQGIVHVYDFVENFAELTRAAATLITKAGPGTISEACASGCPLILSGAIPGQETGNIELVVRGRAGVWAPSPLAVTVALDAWLVGRDAPAALQRAAQGARTMARPRAAHEIAALLIRVAHRDEVTTSDPSPAERLASQRASGGARHIAA